MNAPQVDVCDLLIELLGKPKPENALLFLRVIDALKEQPLFGDANYRYWRYEFRRSGFELQFDSKLGIFDRVRLELRSLQVRSHQPYAGKLPFGIDRDDSPEAAEAKLPGCTMQLKDYRFDRDLRPLVAHFVFGTPDFNQPGVGQRRLKMVYVDYLDSRNPDKAAGLGYDVPERTERTERTEKTERREDD